MKLFALTLAGLVAAAGLAPAQTILPNGQYIPAGGNFLQPTPYRMNNVYSNPRQLNGRMYTTPNVTPYTQPYPYSGTTVYSTPQLGPNTYVVPATGPLMTMPAQPDGTPTIVTASAQMPAPAPGTATTDSSGNTVAWVTDANGNLVTQTTDPSGFPVPSEAPAVQPAAAASVGTPVYMTPSATTRTVVRPARRGIFRR